MMCYPNIPDKTPLAFIFASQKHTLTKKQLQGVADALMSEPGYTKLAKDPFHAVLYAGGRFYANPSVVTDAAEHGGDRLTVVKEQLVVKTCLTIAENCRNARALKMYISKMVHDMNSGKVKESGKNSGGFKYFEEAEPGSACCVRDHLLEDSVEREERCATL